jgi:hypothetical protein
LPVKGTDKGGTLWLGILRQDLKKMGCAFLLKANPRDAAKRHSLIDDLILIGKLFLMGDFVLRVIEYLICCLYDW